MSTPLPRLSSPPLATRVPTPPPSVLPTPFPMLPPSGFAMKYQEVADHIKGGGTISIALGNHSIHQEVGPDLTVKDIKTIFKDIMEDLTSGYQSTYALHVRVIADGKKNLEFPIEHVWGNIKMVSSESDKDE